MNKQHSAAITLANNKDIAKAAAMLDEIYKKDANWRELTKRLPKAGLLTVSEKDMKELVR